jgi:ribose transport system substrate-binding protein
LKADAPSKKAARPIRGRRGAVIKTLTYAAVIAVGLGGCAIGHPQSAAKKTLADYYDKVNAALYAPADAAKFTSTPGPSHVGPLTGQNLNPKYSQVESVPAGPIGDPAKTYTFCFSQGLANNPWSTAQKESLMIEAAKHPNVQIKYTETNDPSQQVADLQSCVSRKVDGILVFPQSVGPLTPAVKAICDAGIFVIGMERTVDTTCPNSWIYLDYKQGAIDIAKSIGDHLKGKGVVVETQGTMGSSPQILRHEGFAGTLATKYPGITVHEATPADFDRTKAYQSALSFLQSPQGQKIDAWYTQYSEMALGVEAALKQTGRTDIPVYTWGDDKPTTAAIESGAVLASVPATPLHADVALRVAINAIDGKKYPKAILLQQPNLLTKQNAAEYAKTTWGSAG